MDNEKEETRRYVKRLLILQFVMAGFALYCLTIFVLIISSLFFPQVQGILDLLLYFGNVAGFAGAVYVIKTWWERRNLLFIVLGVVLLLMNVGSILRFLFA